MFCMSQSVNSKYILSDGFFGIQILQISILAWVHPGPSWGAHDGKITRKLQSLVWTDARFDSEFW